MNTEFAPADQQSIRDLEQALMPEVMRGDVEAFTEVFMLHRQALVCYLQRSVGDDAEDVAHDAYLKALHSHRENPFSDRGKGMRTWLFTIATRAVIDRRRHNKIIAMQPHDFNESAAERLLPEQEDVSQNVTDKLYAQHLLDTLKPTTRSAVMDIVMDGRMYQEHAAAYGIPLGTVKARVHNGIKHMRECALVEADSELQL